MNFDFDDDQKALKEQANRFLKDQCGPAVPRRILESDEPYAKELWDGMVEMGWTATVIPEEFGGIGYGYLELCVMAEEVGRVLAPVPFSSSVYLATEAILAGGSDAQKQALLPKLAAGESIGTFALSEGPRAATAASLTTTFKDGKLDGTKIPVPDGDVADLAIVAAKDSGGAVTLVCVDLTGSGVTRETVSTVDPTRSHAKITFSGAAAEPLGAAGDGWEATQKLLNRAAVLVAFEQVGGADACVAMARNFSVERYAFARPIGSFQAIKHRLADMYVKTELARSNAYYGAWALSTDAPELALAAASARVSANDAFHYASKENIQVHGGMGFTWEHDCHLFYRRSKLLSLTLGSSIAWKDKLVTQLEIQQSA